jgi:hypothetical protein
MIVKPLDERVGHIGGVESVVVNGRRWYFGMDYQSDLVISPLIDDPGEMAEFAARYMAQTDGTHDVAYWADLVSWATDESGLFPPGENEYDSAKLAEGFDDGLLYLLGSASGWGEKLLDEKLLAILSEQGLDDDWDGVAKALETDWDGDFQRRLSTCFASRLPGNWATVFAPLLQSGNENPPKE